MSTSGVRSVVDHRDVGVAGAVHPPHPPRRRCPLLNVGLPDLVAEPGVEGLVAVRLETPDAGVLAKLRKRLEDFLVVPVTPPKPVDYRLDALRAGPE